MNAAFYRDEICVKNDLNVREEIGRVQIFRNILENRIWTFGPSVENHMKNILMLSIPGERVSIGNLHFPAIQKFHIQGLICRDVLRITINKLFQQNTP